MGITEKLMRIQTNIKAPKNLHNSFGNYNYRNAESICEALKPFLESEKVALTLMDDVLEIGGRVYVKATATLYDAESQETFAVSAFAREAVDKKGMDDSQITGATSSYARKYALNGLFLLDDTKDADSDEYRQQIDSGINKEKKGNSKSTQSRDANSLISESEFQTITSMIRNANVNEQELMKQYKVESFMMLTKAQYAGLKQRLEKVMA